MAETRVKLRLECSIVGCQYNEWDGAAFLAALNAVDYDMIYAGGVYIRQAALPEYPKRIGFFWKDKLAGCVSSETEEDAARWLDAVAVIQASTDVATCAGYEVWDDVELTVESGTVKNNQIHYMEVDFHLSATVSEEELAEIKAI